MTLSTDQMGRLIFKAEHESRKNAKKFLKDLNQPATSRDLDAALEMARSDKDAVKIARMIARSRAIQAKTVEAGIDSGVVEMLAAIRLRMVEIGITQEQLADGLGWSTSQVSFYLTGAREPGTGNLAKIASYLGCRWRLELDVQTRDIDTAGG